MRYRFAFSGPAATAVDVVLEAEGIGFEIAASPQPDPEPDVIFRCSTDTYAMVIFGRQKLGLAIEGGLVVAEGDERLVNEFIEAYEGG